MIMKTEIEDWTLEYRKMGYGGPGWYWHYENRTDVWDYGAYDDREAAVEDWKDMVENRGFEVKI